MDWNSMLMAMVESLLPVVVAFLMAMVPVVAGVVVYYVRKWTGIRVTEAQQMIMSGILYDAIGYAEEQTSKARKEGITPPSRRRKMQHAMDYATARALELGLPGVATDALKEMIEARLGGLRELPEKRSYIVGGEE